MINTSDLPWYGQYERYQIEPHIRMPSSDSSLIDVIESRFQIFADRAAYFYKGQVITYKMLDEFSILIACYLQSLGLNVSEKVAVMLPNVFHYPVVTYGILRAGMVVVNINPQLKASELAYQLDDSKAKLLFMHEDCIGSYQKLSTFSHLQDVVICRKHELMKFGAAWHVMLDSCRKLQKWQSNKNQSMNIIHCQKAMEIGRKQQTIHSYLRPALNLQDLAILQYTGGTTGLAKGAMLSHGNLIANLLQNQQVFNSIGVNSQDNIYSYKMFDERMMACTNVPDDDIDLLSETDVGEQGDVIFTVLPLYHIYGFMICGLSAMYLGNTCLLVNTTNLSHLVKLLDRYQPNQIVGVNTLYSRLIQHKKLSKIDFSHTKVSIAGGMAVSSKVAEKWYEITGMPIVQGYGLSETSPVICCNPLSIGKFTGKVGFPVPDTDVVLLDDTDKAVAIGERGEICVKGPQVMKGYYRAIELNQQSFTVDGYFKTGDIGIMDHQGFIKIVDRKKDMIIVSGFNVYPAEIEEVMLTHPAVLECAVIGIPNEDRGEDPKIYIVRQQPVTADAVLDFGKKHLIGYKRPRHVQFVDTLPKSTVGKLLRKALRKMEGLE